MPPPSGVEALASAVILPSVLNPLAVDVVEPTLLEFEYSMLDDRPGGA
jgi:hypothetical protein